MNKSENIKRYMKIINCLIIYFVIKIKYYLLYNEFFKKYIISA